MIGSIRNSLIRHLISIIIVVSLCLIYSNKTGRVYVWFFLPISLIPLAITLWDHYFYQREIKSDDFKKENK